MVAAASDAPSGRADWIFRGADIIDGSGAAPFVADVAGIGDRITAIGDLDRLSADLEVQADGKVLAPGFIDVHTHDDRVLLTDADMTPKVSQGVTTVVVGNCGISMSPFARPGLPPPPFDLLVDKPEHCFSSANDYFQRLDTAPAAVNSLTLIGHTTLRYNALDDLQKTATDAEIKEMQALLTDCLDAGAIGMSSGLFYPPAQAASTEEVAAMAEVLGPRDAIYTAHIRDESDHVMEAIDEAAAIARRGGVQLLISHHKVTDRQNFGRTLETLPHIEELRKSQRVSIDVYPYIASSTVLLPDYTADAEKVIVTWCTNNPAATGRDLDEIAAEMGLDRVAAAEALLPAGAVYFKMNEQDVQRILRFPHAMIGSDGLPSDSHPHPRLWGTFPRVLGHYARDLGLFTLEEAVHRMTGMPAQEFGLVDRGRIEVGQAGDLVMFDRGTIIDRADFADPKQPAAGIECVMVNGDLVWQAGSATGARPGRALRISDTDRGS